MPRYKKVKKRGTAKQTGPAPRFIRASTLSSPGASRSTANAGSASISESERLVTPAAAPRTAAAAAGAAASAANQPSEAGAAATLAASASTISGRVAGRVTSPAAGGRSDSPPLRPAAAAAAGVCSKATTATTIFGTVAADLTGIGHAAGPIRTTPLSDRPCRQHRFHRPMPSETIRATY